MTSSFLAFWLAASAIAAYATTDPVPSDASCGPSRIRFTVRSRNGHSAIKIPTGKALVYVAEVWSRPVNQLGKPTIRVGVDGSWIGANRSNSYFFFFISPGEHHFCADWQQPPAFFAGRPNTSFADLNIEEGGIYYLRAQMTQNHDTDIALDLRLVSGAEGQYLVANSPFSVYSLKK